MVTRLTAILVAATIAAEPPTDDAVKKEIEKLQGTWVCASLEGQCALTSRRGYP